LRLLDIFVQLLFLRVVHSQTLSNASQKGCRKCCNIISFIDESSILSSLWLKADQNLDMAVEQFHTPTSYWKQLSCNFLWNCAFVESHYYCSNDSLRSREVFLNSKESENFLEKHNVCGYTWCFGCAFNRSSRASMHFCKITNQHIIFDSFCFHQLDSLWSVGTNKKYHYLYYLMSMEWILSITIIVWQNIICLKIQYLNLMSIEW